MKLKSSNNQYQSNVTGKKIQMGFSADAASHLAELMSNSVYQDKYGSIVREVVSNAVDANVESSSTRKVEVSITEKPSLSDGVGYLDVQDYGPGISPDRIENIFTQYFASTKRDTNDQIGGFGIGAKSPFAYTPVFQVITVVSGVKRTYLMEKTTGDRTCTLIDEVKIPGAPSGTLIRIPIQDKYDEAKFVRAIEDQLILLSNRLVINIPSKHVFYMPKVIDFGNIFCIEHEDGSYMQHDGSMISLGDVLYKIPHKDRYNAPTNYVLKFEIGELSPTLSREGIELNDEALVLIHNAHHQVTNLIEEEWVPEQTKPTLDFVALIEGHGNASNVVFPGTRVPVLHFNPEHVMTRKFPVKIRPIGWPAELDFWRFNQLVSKILSVSHRYNVSKSRFTSPKVINLVRDVIQTNSYNNGHEIIIKKPNDTLAGVWKEWFLDTQTDGLKKSVAVLTINTDIASCIRLVFETDLKKQINADELVDQVEDIIINSMNPWLKDKPKFKDLKPSEEWLEERRNKRKTQKTTTWSADALKEACPVRVVVDGCVSRGTRTYLEMLKPGNVVIANKVYKELHLSADYKQPVTFIIVSESNYKRCKAAGAHCWTMDDVIRINKRRERQFIDKNKLTAIDSWMANEYNRSTSVIFDSGKSVNGSLLKIKNRKTQKRKVLLKDPYLYLPDNTNLDALKIQDSILYDGRKYSQNKIKLINRNFQNIMERKACTRLVAAILDNSYRLNSAMYTDLLTSLNLNTHDS